jgi:hypothetical protein
MAFDGIDYGKILSTVMRNIQTIYDLGIDSAGISAQIFVKDHLDLLPRKMSIGSL